MDEQQRVEDALDEELMDPPGEEVLSDLEGGQDAPADEPR
jgi:hypothetical protein